MLIVDVWSLLMVHCSLLFAHCCECFLSVFLQDL
jgi:hypothetical protein